MIIKITEAVLDRLKDRIARAGANDALALARLYGNIAWNNPVGVFEAGDIEQLLYAKVSSVIPGVLQSAPHTKNCKILHVLTEGYTSGGHTRVLERLVSIRTDVPEQDAVIVEICPEPVISRIKSFGADLHTITASGVTAIEDLATLMVRYSYVVLHIHPDDVISSLAARIARESGTLVGLYNHADHCFTFGMHSVDVVCEISAYGRAVSDEFRPATPWSFAGIPLDVGAALRSDTEVQDYVLSSGPAYKYDFTDGGAFVAISKAVKQAGKKLRIIGPGTLPSNASPVLQQLVKEGAIDILPAVPHHDYVRFLRACAVYIDSAPITGGSALPEAALLGIPCLGLENPIMGYSPIDATRSTTIEDLVTRVAGLCKTVSHPASTDMDGLLNVHSPRMVIGRIVASLSDHARFPVPYRVNRGALDTRYFKRQWIEKRQLVVNTRGFDYISVATRVWVFFMLASTGALSLIGPSNILKIFFSNIRSRKFRNR